MSQTPFPTDTFVATVVQLMDTIQHNDVNYTHDERVGRLSYAYKEAAYHFAQPHVREVLQVKPKKLQAALQTITGMVVYCWVNASPELCAALTIHYTYTLVLDDSEDDPYANMQDFFGDMVNGKTQKHPWWKLVNDHFPNVLKHYGPFCSLNIYRSTVDFFEGCWIEQYAFNGYKGSSDYPDFLRRMNGLGHAVGASIWPADMFDERRLFREITTAICMMENWMVWVNDLISFYKEFDDERDQTSLVNNYCHVEGLTVDEGLRKLTTQTLKVSEELMAVFKDKDPRLVDTLTRFMHGYVTWHLCDKRYRISEIYEQICNSDDPVKQSFCRYFDNANKVGRVNADEWATPKVDSIQLDSQTLTIETPLDAASASATTKQDTPELVEPAKIEDIEASESTHLAPPTQSESKPFESEGERDTKSDNIGGDIASEWARSIKHLQPSSDTSQRDKRRRTEPEIRMSLGNTVTV